MRKLKCSLIVAVATIMFLSACNTNSSKVRRTVEIPNYALKLETSDGKFDDFYNEFYQRHMGVDSDMSVAAQRIGETGMFNIGWTLPAGMFFDSTSTGTPTQVNCQSGYKSMLNGVGIDKFGYVYNGYDNVDQSGTVKAMESFATQNWPFPNYGYVPGYALGYEFNTTDLLGWSVNHGTVETKNGYLKTSYIGNDNFEIISPDLVTSNRESEYYLNWFYAPFIDMQIKITDNQAFLAESSVKDIYLSWQNTLGDEWYTVSYKEFSTKPEKIYEIFHERIFWPMYLHPQWKDHNIKKIKIIIVPKEGEVSDYSILMNYFRSSFDVRHVNNNGEYINCLKEYIGFTNDFEVLKNNLNRARQSMLFMLNALDGKNGILRQNYLVGHDSIVDVGHGISCGYWDVLPSCFVNLESNIYFYRALGNLAILEELASMAGITVEQTSVANPDGFGGVIEYHETPESLRLLQKKVSECICKDVEDGGLWVEETGRLAFGIKNDGTAMDYGYTIFNMQAIESGLVPFDKAKSIMDWISGERIVEGDTSTGKQIYYADEKDEYYDMANKNSVYYRSFAPRVNTLENKTDFIWSGASTYGTLYGVQLQNGGTPLFTAYFDLLSRLKVYGIDNMFERFKGIQSWYDLVKSYGGTGSDFYRYYYDDLGIPVNGAGGGAIYPVGIGAEFIESAIVYAAVPYGFFGIDTSEYKTIGFTPNVPSDLEYMLLHNLMFAGIKYSARITNDEVRIYNIASRYSDNGYSLKVNLKSPSKDFGVYLNDKKLNSSEYTVNGSEITVTVPFVNCTIKVK